MSHSDNSNNSVLDTSVMHNCCCRHERQTRGPNRVECGILRSGHHNLTSLVIVHCHDHNDNSNNSVLDTHNTSVTHNCCCSHEQLQQCTYPSEVNQLNSICHDHNDIHNDIHNDNSNNSVLDTQHQCQT